MRITKKHFNSVLLELIDENPIASRGILRVCKVVFTEDVPTLAISIMGEPKLSVNIGFVNKHCRTEAHVKAVLIHEFLHVLLNHTERFKCVTRAINVALDAVINAIIHRSFGPEYSGMMSEYYANAEGALRLLRPMMDRETRVREDRLEPDSFTQLWVKLYEGKLVVDDLLEIAASLEDPNPGDRVMEEDTFLGNHCGDSGDTEELSPEVETTLRETLRSMTGGGIWRKPVDRGIGIKLGEIGISAEDRAIKEWEREAAKVLTSCVTPDKRSRVRLEERTMSIPLLNESDKRGFLRSLWSPFLPDIVWKTQEQVRIGTTQIYLDVSGSMDLEMDALVSLIWRLRRHIRLPFWAFSDEVAPAVIKDGRLVTSTTGGTAMNSVLEHVARTCPGKAVIITDGFIEKCDPKLLSAVKGQDIRAIVSRSGSPAELERAGIPYLQLGRFYK